MADNLKERLASLSGKLKVGGAEVSKKVSISMVTVGDKMKELFRVPTPADKLIEELTSEDPLLQQTGLDWARIMELCDSIRSREISGQEVVKALKKRLMVKANNSIASLDTYTCSRIQLLTLTLIEACVKNCEHLFVDIANEHLLDEIVKIIDDPSTSIVARDKALKLIEAWGESAPELRNLPMFEETYKSLKSRGVKFPLRDPESLAPIFTPPQTVDVTEKLHKPRRTYREIVGDSQNDLTLPTSEELIHTARNSVDLLLTVLTSSPQQEVLQSLKSRGVKFPLRDPESLAPIFTPPQTVDVTEKVHKPRRTYREIVGDTQNDLTLPTSEELIHTARNSVDLLSTVLTSSPQQEVLQDDLTSTLVEQCHRSQFMVQRVVEQLNDNEALLFEALNLNDELQKVLAKYEEMLAENVRSPPSIQTEDSKSVGGSEVTTIGTTPENAG